MHQSALEEKAREMAEEARQAANFKATPAKVLAAPAFVPRKSTKPLTQITETNVPFAKSLERQERRKVLEEQMATKRVQMELEAEEKAKKAAAQAAKEIAALRATMVPKARKAAVLSAAPFAIVKNAEKARPLTVAKSPNLMTADRSALRVA